MIKAADLKARTVRELCALARKMGLTGIHSMRKDQLVCALVNAAKAKSSRSGRSSATSAKSQKKTTSGARVMGKGTTAKARPSESVARGPRTTQPAKPKNLAAMRRIREARAKREQLKDLSFAAAAAASNGNPPKKKKAKRAQVVDRTPGKDRVVLLVRDSYWLQACWDITRQSVQRAQAAMAEHWHTAEPVLRLLHVDTGATTSTSERVVREIPIHGGVQNWYIDLKDSPNSYRVELGYRAENGRFYALARSNIVSTPRPGSSDAIDENWSDIAANYEKIYALSGGYLPASGGGDLRELFEERLRRPMGSPLTTQFGAGANRVLRRDHDFSFHVDAELIIYGVTKPDAHVTLSGEPVKLRPDGSFTVRRSMPDRRQVLPVVASSRDGVEQRTIVIAVERNTKVMEPMIRESHE